MQRRVDRRRARVQVERAVEVALHHRVLDRGLRALFLRGAVDFLQRDELVLVERGEILALGGAQVAAGALDPEHLDRLAGERILLRQLGRGVAAAGVGDALVGAEQVGAVDQPADRIERGGVLVVPKIIDEGIGGGAHDFWWLSFWKRVRTASEKPGAGDEGLRGKGFFDDAAQMASRFEMAERQRLDQDVADGGRLDRAGDDGQAGGVGRELVEQIAAAAAADDVELLELAPDESLQLAQRLRVGQREAFEDGADELARRGRHGLRRSRGKRR